MKWQSYSGVGQEEEGPADGHFISSAHSTDNMEPQRHAQQQQRSSSSSRAHPSLGWDTTQTMEGAHPARLNSQESDNAHQQRRA
jgi:hypothetical protein